MNKNRLNIIIGVAFLALVLVALAPLLWDSSVTGYTYMGPTGKNFTFSIDKEAPIDYHILEFSYFDAGENVKRKRTLDIPFEYSPKELESIQVPEDIRNSIFSSEIIAFLSDPTITEKIDNQDMVARETIRRIVNEIYKKDTIRANTVEVDWDDAATGSCDDATPTSRVIYIMQGNHNEVYYDADNEYCIVLEFDKPKDAVKVATRLVYSILNVMP